MNTHGPRSLLHTRPEMFDKADHILSASDLRDIYDQMQETHDTLELQTTHRLGTLSLAEETIGRSHFQGVVLHMPEPLGLDISLMANQESSRRTYVMSIREYAKGAKTEVGFPEAISMLPFASEIFFISKRDETVFSAQELRRICNLPPISADRETLAPKEDELLLEAENALSHFTLYSLYKVTNFMDFLRLR